MITQTVYNTVTMKLLITPLTMLKILIKQDKLKPESEKTMKENELTIPDPEHKKQQNQPTLNRLFKYMENCHVSLVYVSATKTLHLSGLTPELMKLLLHLEPYVTKYYAPINYKNFIERVYSIVL